MTAPEPCQRWKERRPRYRPSGERIRPSEYGVDVLHGDREARAFVETHHYAGSFPAAVCRVGLYRAGPLGSRLVGVAVFSVPMQAAAVPRWLGCPAADGIELGRFVLLDEVPGDGESWFLARAFRALKAEKPRLTSLVSYSDPVSRTDARTGRTLTPGHIGVIYQATNARYMGRAAARTRLYLPDGREVSERALSKLRADDKGAAYVTRQLAASGLPVRRFGEDGATWLERITPLLRRVRHPGNHVYGWTWAPEDRRAAALPYPKKEPAP